MRMNNLSKSDLKQEFELEADLTKYVKRYLISQRDLDFDKMSGVPKGIPDFLVCLNGKLIFLELKGINYISTPHQIEFKRRYIKVGAIAVTIRCLQDVIDTLKQARR